MTGAGPLLETYGWALLGAGLVAVALLVNAFVPGRRHRLRAAVILYVTFVAVAAIEAALRQTRAPFGVAWAAHLHLATSLLAAFTCVRLAALAVFDVALPVLRVPIVAITGDVVVGVAYLFATIGVLRVEGVATSSVFATSALVSGVVALSLQTTLGNIVGGVALQVDGSVHVGDWIQLPDGQQGHVTAIRWRHTVLETRNGDTLVVPNANLLAQTILILGKRADRPRQRRMWVYFNVDFRFPPTRVIDVVGEAVRGSPIAGVAADPPPNVVCFDFARDGRDSFAYYAVRYWLTDLANDDATSSRVRSVLYAALRRADIPLARPSRTLFVEAEEDDAARARRHEARRRNAIEHVELFAALTDDERTYVCARLHDAPFAAGETITHQGAVAHWLYILGEGQVEVRRHGAADPSVVQTVATIRAPGYFGEMGLLTGEPRRADVVATSDVQCYRLDKEGFEHVLRERPEIAATLSKTLAEREVGLSEVVQDLDERAHRARLATAEGRILTKIQQFFGLEETAAGPTGDAPA